MTSSDKLGQRPGREHPDSVINAASVHASPTAESSAIPLNDAAAVFAVLAEAIRGSAVGWSPSALQRLEDGLSDQYGPALGSERAVKQLVVLASEPAAA